jgi:hypothetical protein
VFLYNYSMSCTGSDGARSKPWTVGFREISFSMAQSAMKYRPHCERPMVFASRQAAWIAISPTPWSRRLPEGGCRESWGVGSTKWSGPPPGRLRRPLGRAELVPLGVGRPLCAACIHAKHKHLRNRRNRSRGLSLISVWVWLVLERRTPSIPKMP